MSSQLLQTQSNTLLLVVEVENNDIQLLIELYNLFGVRNTSPRQVGDVNQTVYATQVNEYPIRGDVLNGSFQYLTFLQFGDNFFFLLLQFGFDERFVRSEERRVGKECRAR